MAIDAVTATLVAGLGGGLIGAGGATSVAMVGARSRARSEHTRAKAAAYSRLIAVKGLLVHSANILRLTMQVRSGIKEGFDIALRLRKPLDPIALNAELRKDLDPLYQAWGDVWTIGTQQAIEAGNELIGCGAKVMGSATAHGRGRSGVTRALIGEKWTPAQLAEWNGLIQELAETRRRFAEVARSELGHEIADLFAGRLDS